MVPFLLEGGNSMQVLKYGNTVEGQMNLVCDGKDATWDLMNYNHANIGITEGGKQSLFICQKDVVPYTISGVRKGGRVFFYLPKDVSYNLMPIWKHRRGKSIFLCAGKMLNLTWCQYGSTERWKRIFLCAGKMPRLDSAPPTARSDLLAPTTHTIGTSWCVRTLHYHNNNIKHNKQTP